MSSISEKEFIFGFHTISALLTSHPERILQLFRQAGREDTRIQEILQLAEYHHIPVQSVSKNQCDAWAKQRVHQGILAQIKRTKLLNDQDLWTLLKRRLKKVDKPLFLLLLDAIQDPHNLGACLRTANAAGVDAVIVPSDRSVSMTPAVRKVAAGAVEMTPLFSVTNLATTLEKLKAMGVWCYGLDQSGSQLIYETILTGALALVLGAEDEGLRRLTKERCDALVTIPMFGRVSSLNVSVAAGISLFEAVRQRQ